MQRKHGELGPIGEVVSGLDDVLVPTIRDASPQARHHFTQADQVNQLATAREADPDRGFMARMMVLCSLPRSNPGNRIRYVRRNGPYTLVMNAGGLHKLPFGNLPRLLLAWASTEAVKTGKRDLVLGRSLSGFMRKLDMSDDSGSPRGDRTRLRNQMKRLFNASVQLIYEDATVAATASSFIADRSVFWWNERKPDEQVLFNSEIRLSEAFFNEIIRRPVPLDMNILKALKRCALGLNLYLWINYRTFALRAPLRLSWRRCTASSEWTRPKPAISAPSSTFGAKVLRELKKIKLAWPALNYSTPPGVLILHPSTPAIAPVGQAQLTS